MKQSIKYFQLLYFVLITLLVSCLACSGRKTPEENPEKPDSLSRDTMDISEEPEPSNALPEVNIEIIDPLLIQTLDDTTLFQKTYFDYKQTRAQRYYSKDRRCTYFVTPLHEESEPTDKHCYYFFSDANPRLFYRINVMQEESRDVNYTVEYFSGDLFFEYYKTFSTDELVETERPIGYQKLLKSEILDKIKSLKKSANASKPVLQ